LAPHFDRFAEGAGANELLRELAVGLSEQQADWKFCL